jgi:LmbE family N-acetylglucosaminyl deacetylase
MNDRTKRAGGRTHPDDIEIGCGGTVALLAQRRFEITHEILTSGGGQRPVAPPGNRACPGEGGPRGREDPRAANVVDSCEYPDGLTGFTREMKIDIIRIVRRLRPHILFVHERNESSLGHRGGERARARVRAGRFRPLVPGGGRRALGPRAPPRVRSLAPRWDATSWPSTSRRPWRRSFGPSPATAHRRRPSATTSRAGACPLRGVMSLSGGDAEVFEVIRVSQGALIGFSS